MPKISVELKAGNSVQTADVNIECACNYGALKSSQVISKDSENESRSLKVYPNPTSGKVILGFENFKNPDVVIHVYNTTGQKIFDHEYKLSGQIELDLSGNTTGLYFINVIADGISLARSIYYIEK